MLASRYYSSESVYVVFVEDELILFAGVSIIKKLLLHCKR